MSRVFLSCVSSEFESYRTLLTHDLRRAGVDLRVQEDFGVAGGTLLAALDRYIRECSAVVHLIGEGSGWCPAAADVSSLLTSYHDFTARVSALRDLPSESLTRISFTQWESYLAIYHGRRLHIYRATDTAPRGSRFVRNADEAALQAAHFQRISDLGRQWGPFENEARLSNYVLADLREILPPPVEPFVAAPSRLLGDTGVFEGREQTLGALDRLWANVLGEAPGGARIVSLVAIGGAGKTALVSRWKNALLARDGHGGVERYFDWSFYNQGAHEEIGKTETDATEFVASALRFFGDAETADRAGSPWDKGARLATLAARYRTLLVLDGLEPLQHPPGPQQGEIRDDAIRALFAGLQTGRGLCIVTTRVRLRDLEATASTTTPQWPLDHLTDVAGAAVLRAHGVIGPQHELETASREVKGHALTLGLMGRYLRLAFDPADIARRDCFHVSEADTEVRNGSAFRALAAYETWFESEGRQIESAILRLLGLFDRPATPDCLTALCSNPPIAGLTEPLMNLSHAQWNAAIERLKELDLVQTLDWSPARVSGYGEELATHAMEEGWRNTRTPLGRPEPFERRDDSLVIRRSLDTHPIVREYSASRLGGTDIATAAHARLFEYLQTTVPYWPEGQDGLVPLYQAIVHGCRAARYNDAFTILWDRINRGSTGPLASYSTNSLGLFGLELAALACFFIVPWRQLPEALYEHRRLLVLNATSLALSAVSRASEAREPLRAALEIALELNHWRNACICAYNLSDLEMDAGSVPQAEAAIRRAQTFVDDDRHTRTLIDLRARHGWIVHQAGSFAESRKAFEDAEALQPDHEHAYPLLYAVHGFNYCELLLQEAEVEAWRRWCSGSAAGAANPLLRETLSNVDSRAAQTLGWVSSAQAWPLPIGLDHLTLARVEFLRTFVTGAGPAANDGAAVRRHLDSALASLQRANDNRYLIGGLLSSAWFHAWSSEWESARQRLDEAFQLITRGGMGRTDAVGRLRLRLVDYLLYRARIFGVPAASAAAPYPWAGCTPRGDLAEAERLISECGYHRRDEELRDAQRCLAAS